MRKPLLIFMALTLGACSMIKMARQGTLEKNRATWQATGISHYRYYLTLSCFCTFALEMPLVIEVRDGQVVSMQYLSGSQIDPADREVFKSLSTIDRIFASVKADIDRGGDKLKILYNETYGFPIQVDIDVSQEIYDDESTLTVSSFEILP